MDKQNKDEIVDVEKHKSPEELELMPCVPIPSTSRASLSGSVAEEVAIEEEKSVANLLFEGD